MSFQGKYECVASNSVGTEHSYSAQLYVRGTKSLLVICTVDEHYLDAKRPLQIALSIRSL